MTLTHSRGQIRRITNYEVCGSHLCSVARTRQVIRVSPGAQAPGDQFDGGVDGHAPMRAGTNIGSQPMSTKLVLQARPVEHLPESQPQRHNARFLDIVHPDHRYPLRRQRPRCNVALTDTCGFFEALNPCIQTYARSLSRCAKTLSDPAKRISG